MSDKKKRNQKARLRMSVNQSREDNKASFVRRLVEAGWSCKEAEAEYERETA